MIEDKFLTKSKFTKLIEKTVGELNIPYMEAVLEVCNKKLPKDIEVFARTKKNNIMGIKIKNRNIYGLQFHPESIATDFGKKFFENFVNECKRLKK